MQEILKEFPWAERIIDGSMEVQEGMKNNCLNKYKTMTIVITESCGI